MSRPLRGRVPLFVSLAAAALLYAIYAIQSGLHPTLWSLQILDAEVYLETGRDIAAGDWFGGSEAFPLSPLYFYVVALFQAVDGDGVVPVIVWQLLLAIGNLALVGDITRRIYREQTSAVVYSVALAALYAPFAFMATKLMATTLAVFLSLASIDLLLRAREEGWRLRCLAPGLVMGAACLARPNTLLFVPLAALWLVRGAGESTLSGSVKKPELSTQRRRLILLRLSALLGGVALSLAPVTSRNYEVERDWILISSQAGITFYQANHPQANGSYSVVPGFAGNIVDQSREAREFAERAEGRRLSSAGVSRYWLGEGLRHVAADPARAAWLVSRKLLLWLGSDEISNEYSLTAERELTPTLWLMPLPFGAILALALVGWRETPLTARRQGLWLVGLFVLSNLASVLAFFFASRYRIPAVAALCVPAGFGAHVVIDHVRHARFRGLVVRHWASVAVLGLSLWSWTDLDRTQAAVAFYNLGVANHRLGAHDESVVCIERSLDELDERWQVHEQLAVSYQSAGRYRDAARQYTRALELNPYLPDGLERLRDAKQRGRAAEQPPP